MNTRKQLQAFVATLNDENQQRADLTVTVPFGTIVNLLASATGVDISEDDRYEKVAVIAANPAVLKKLQKVFLNEINAAIAADLFADAVFDNVLNKGALNKLDKLARLS